MKSEDIKKLMKKQGYRFIGNHGAVKICLWTKRSLRDEGVCYKEKFYGIKSHLCCQITPWLGCPNHCIHCWRAVEFDFDKAINKNKIDSPKEIIEESIKAQRKLLQGFNIDKKSKKKQLSRANQKKYQEAQEPMHFAISLSGEPTVYEKIGELIEELKKRGKTSFLVTNGLYPKKLEEIEKNNQLPTQLYISVNVPNKEMYQKFHRSSKKNAWKKLMKSLEIMAKLRNKTRTIFRMNLVRDLNMDDKYIKEYAKLIRNANPLFIEIKGFMSVGFARQRLGYNRMPTHEEMKSFAEKLAKETKLKILDSHERSRAYVLGKNKSNLKIKKI